MEFPAQIEFWHWWVLAIVLIVIEILAPGAVFVWLGISAGVVGVLVLVVPAITWQAQAIAFAVISVGAIAGWRVYHRRHPTPTDQPVLNRRGEQYVGRRLTLGEPIVNNQGKIKIDDTTWKVEGENLPAGTQIEVVSVDGVVLKVEKV